VENLKAFCWYKGEVGEKKSDQEVADIPLVNR